MVEAVFPEDELNRLHHAMTTNLVITINLTMKTNNAMMIDEILVLDTPMIIHTPTLGPKLCLHLQWDTIEDDQANLNTLQSFHHNKFTTLRLSRLSCPSHSLL